MCCNIHINDGIIGKGVIENARETIGHGLATVRQGAAYMKNSARSAIAISEVKAVTPQADPHHPLGGAKGHH